MSLSSWMMSSMCVSRVYATDIDATRMGILGHNVARSDSTSKSLRNSDTGDVGDLNVWPRMGMDPLLGKSVLERLMM